MEGNKGKIVIVGGDLSGKYTATELAEFISNVVGDTEAVKIIDATSANVHELGNEFIVFNDSLLEEYEKQDILYRKMEKLNQSQTWKKSNQKHPAFRRR